MPVSIRTRGLTGRAARNRRRASSSFLSSSSSSSFSVVLFAPRRVRIGAQVDFNLSQR